MAKETAPTTGKPAQASTSAAAPAPAKKKKKIHVDVNGKAFIKATFNNVIVTLTDIYGNTIAWSSAGKNGFKGSRKNTPFAAQVSAEAAAKEVYDMGLRKVEVLSKDPVRTRSCDPFAADRRARGFNYSRYHADPAQRLPPAQAPTRVTVRSIFIHQIEGSNDRWHDTLTPVAGSADANARSFF